ncbi:MAG: haloacid dehalogenase type II [Thermoleophilia bacterium]
MPERPVHDTTGGERHLSGEPAVHAVLFDVFGTLYDWRSSVARDAARIAGPHAPSDIDWNAFAEAWRGRYQPQLATVREGRRPWVDLDVLHAEALDDVLAEFGIDLPGHRRPELTRAWHRLDPWPDTVAGVARLRRRFIVAPNSNGHIALLVHLARASGLVWDAVLGAEVARAYKPLPVVYDTAVAALGLRPEQVLMVAAHPDDLVAAAARGLRTAFVRRPEEWGSGPARDPDPPAGVDLVTGDIEDLATRLGA